MNANEKIIDFNKLWNNRQDFETKCKENNACEKEFNELVSTKNKNDWLKIIYENFEWTNKHILKKLDKAWNFHNGFTQICINDKWGFLKQDGTMLTEFIYDHAWGFKNGFAQVCINGEWGYIKLDGTKLTECIYDVAHRF